MAVPYFGAFNLTRALLPGMMARRSGHIVTIGSPATLLMWPGAAAYIAARWAVHGFTEALRMDVRGLGIGVTLVIPGKVESDYFAHNPGSVDRVPKVIRLTAALSTDDVARAVIRGIERRKRQIVIPFGLRVLALGHALSPRIGCWIGARTGAQRPQQQQMEKACLSSQ
jgi:short-subunit dehydrogenase